MDNTDYNLIIYGSAAVIGFLTFVNEIAKIRYIRNLIRRKGYQWLSRFKTVQFKIIVFIIFSGLGVFAAIEKEAYNQRLAVKDQNDRDDKAAKEMIRRDILAEKSRRESNNEIVSTFADGLATYGLKYDSTTKVVHRLMKDSMRRESKFLSMSRPTLDLDNILLTKLSNDSLTVQLKFLCTESTAYNVHLPVKYGYYNPTEQLIYYLGTYSQPIAGGGQIATGRMRTVEISLPRQKNIEMYVFYINGKYSDIPDLKLTYPIERLAKFNLSKKEMSFATDENDDITRFFKSL